MIDRIEPTYMLEFSGDIDSLPEFHVKELAEQQVTEYELQSIYPESGLVKTKPGLAWVAVHCRYGMASPTGRLWERKG